MTTSAPTEAQQPGASFDVMTFNIRGDFDGGVPTPNPRSWLTTTGTDRRDLVIEVIRDAAPDILGVQEAFANQVADLVEAFPGYGHYGVGRDDGERAGEHSAIFFDAKRFTAVDQGTFWLSETPDVAGSIFPGAATVRIASWVRLDDAVTGGELFVLNTHWDHVSQAAREHGAGLIRDHLAGLPATLPVVVMGDLNVNEDNAAYQLLLNAAATDGRALVDSYREVHPVRDIQEGTFNAFTGATFGARIDHVLHGRRLEATGAAIVRTEFDGRNASDHYPVTARLRPVPEPGSIAGVAAAVAVLQRRRR